VQVTVNQNVTADAGDNKTIIAGESVMLNGRAGGDEITGITWTPATGLDNPSSATPVASPTESTSYTMHVSSATCGIATSSVFVRVLKKIVIPNTFSPNGDGINDTWNVDALSDYPDALVQVFDRYGRQIFESKGYGKPWNGTYKGSLLPEGAYYYIIDLKNNTQKRSGWVFILR
jgi:gliding motility-associated-like protein